MIDYVNDFTFDKTRIHCVENCAKAWYGIIELEVAVSAICQSAYALLVHCPKTQQCFGELFGALKCCSIVITMHSTIGLYKNFKKEKKIHSLLQY